MKRTVYKLSGERFGRHFKAALVTDLHSGPPEKVIEMLKKECPDYILLGGDIVEALDGSCDGQNERAFGIFKACADIAPTFYCTGNHEDGGCHSERRKWKQGEGKPRIYTRENRERIEASGVNFLLNSYAVTDGIAFGGLASGLINKGGEPDINFLDEFSSVDTPKILICHHPEYYEKYIKERDIDLTVSGHAHGGQWRIFGRGIYAPGQGLFPKYTSGVYDGRLVVSRGLKKWIIPRFFNRKEIVIIEV